MSLKTRSGCERCGTALGEGGIAFVCVYEWASCPNCGGGLVARTRRPSGRGVVSV